MVANFRRLYRWSNEYIMIKFTDTTHCTNHDHCHNCRKDPEAFKALITTYEWDGECPYGVTSENLTVKISIPPPVKPKKNCKSCQEKKQELMALHNKMNICRMCPMIDDDSFCLRACMDIVDLAAMGEACPNGSWTVIDE